MVQNIVALLKDQLDDNLIGKIAGFRRQSASVSIPQTSI